MDFLFKLFGGFLLFCSSAAFGGSAEPTWAGDNGGIIPLTAGDNGGIIPKP